MVIDGFMANILLLFLCPSDWFGGNQESILGEVQQDVVQDGERRNKRRLWETAVGYDWVRYLGDYRLISGNNSIIYRSLLYSKIHSFVSLWYVCMVVMCVNWMCLNLTPLIEYLW